jgi:hypothetical protein
MGHHQSAPALAAAQAADHHGLSGLPSSTQGRNEFRAFSHGLQHDCNRRDLGSIDEGCYRICGIEIGLIPGRNRRCEP